MKVYEFCPDLTIQIGVPTDTTFSSFAGGDFPLGVILPNVTIEGNGATLVGGVYQFVTLAVFQYEAPAPIGTLTFNKRQDDVTIKNLAFSGPLFQIDGFASSSMTISGPGDILFENIVMSGYDFAPEACSSRPIYIGEARIQPGLTPPESISVEFDGLTISDAQLSNCTSLILSESQTVYIKNSRIFQVDAASSLSCENANPPCVISNSCITDSTFYMAPLRMGDYDPAADPVPLTVSNVYVDGITINYLGENDTTCFTELLQDFEIAGDGLANCIDLPTADTCSLDENSSTASPTSAPTKMPTEPTTGVPTSEPSMEPSGTICRPMVSFMAMGLALVAALLAHVS
eukprot:scaffold6655_cov169-Amphora_coffeaeformis.AAC.36